MIAHDEQQQIARTHNTARFFTETRHVAWVLLIGTVLWGAYGYLTMPQRKDPEIPVRQALAMCPWPGASVGSSRVDLQACKLEYSIVSPK